MRPRLPPRPAFAPALLAAAGFFVLLPLPAQTDPPAAPPADAAAPAPAEAAPADTTANPRRRIVSVLNGEPLPAAPSRPTRRSGRATAPPTATPAGSPEETTTTPPATDPSATVFLQRSRPAPAAAPATTEPSAPTPVAPDAPLPPHYQSILAARPAPPQQDAPWTPPAATAVLNDKLFAAANQLFALGLADPRGCEYQEIAYDPNPGAPGRRVPGIAHGWVLPATPGGGQRFAIAWDGLMLPILEIRGPADLRTDVAAAVQADQARFDEQRRNNPNRRATRFPFNDDRFDQGGLNLGTPSPLAALLLLRAGENDLAAQLLERWSAEINPEVNNFGVLLDDPGKFAAYQWLRGVSERASLAHRRGEDAVALATLRLADRALAQIHPTAAGPTRGSSPEQRFWDNYFRDVAPAIATLRTDQERRAAEPPRVRPWPADSLSFGGVKDEAAILAGLKVRYPEQTARLAALIADLDQTGGDEPPWTTQALAAEGPAAVEALLVCFETDNRLTRNSQPVHQVAFGALRQIMQTDVFPSVPGTPAPGRSTRSTRGQPAQPPSRKPLADAIRAYWAANAGLTEEDRWYAALREGDDPRQWREAADKIIAPANHIPGMKPPESEFPWYDPKTPLRGEILRAKTNPSVSELLTRHAITLVSGDNRNYDEASRLAFVLAKWDGPAAIPVLEELHYKFTQPINGGRLPAGYALNLLRALEWLNALGWQEKYAALLRAEPSLAFGREPARPLWMHAGHPVIAATNTWLFTDPASPWLAETAAAPGYGEMWDAFSLPLLGLPEFRQLTQNRLNSETVIGTVRVASPQRLEIVRPDGTSAGTRQPLYGDAFAPEVGAETPVRVKDYLAVQLSGRLEGLPRFALYWPQEKRDAAIAQMQTFLEHYATALAYNATLLDELATREPYVDRYQARLSFPRRDRPATAAEVTAGTAIFSLPEGARTAALEQFPMRAKWTTLKEFPTVSTQMRPNAAGVMERIERVNYIQDGWVWQAEEVQENGEWKRYYGFVGPYIIAKVPAEEIHLEVRKLMTPEEFLEMTGGAAPAPPPSPAPAAISP